MACARLCLEGTRGLIATPSMQVTAYMQRKGVSGVISTARQSNFLRSMSLAVLNEYVAECGLFAATLQPGDLLYCPYGSIQGELVQQLTFGVRVPLVVKPEKDPNVVMGVKRRLQETELTLRAGTNQSPETKQKLTFEIELLKEILSFLKVTEGAAGAVDGDKQEPASKPQPEGQGVGPSGATAKAKAGPNQ